MLVTVDTEAPTAHTTCHPGVLLSTAPSQSLVHARRAHRQRAPPPSQPGGAQAGLRPLLSRREGPCQGPVLASPSLAAPRPWRLSLAARCCPVAPARGCASWLWNWGATRFPFATCAPTICRGRGCAEQHGAPQGSLGHSGPGAQVARRQCGCHWRRPAHSPLSPGHSNPGCRGVALGGCWEPPTLTCPPRNTRRPISQQGTRSPAGTQPGSSLLGHCALWAQERGQGGPTPPAQLLPASCKGPGRPARGSFWGRWDVSLRETEAQGRRELLRLSQLGQAELGCTHAAWGRALPPSWFLSSPVTREQQGLLLLRKNRRLLDQGAALSWVQARLGAGPRSHCPTPRERSWRCQHMKRPGVAPGKACRGRPGLCAGQVQVQPDLLHRGFAAPLPGSRDSCGGSAGPGPAPCTHMVGP